MKSDQITVCKAQDSTKFTKLINSALQPILPIGMTYIHCSRLILWKFWHDRAKISSTTNKIQRTSQANLLEHSSRVLNKLTPQLWISHNKLENLNQGIFLRRRFH